ncbi:MAG: hypothetical protein R2851_20875 [Caldilineaceae bacterium]
MLRTSSPDGTLVWGGRRSPGAGRFSTITGRRATSCARRLHRHWPDWAGPGAHSVEVGVQPFGEELLMPNGTGVHPYAPLGTLEYTPVQ